jgi:hypothetical protein
MAPAESYSRDISHISRYAPFHVMWPLHKVIPVMLATSKDPFHVIWPVHKIIPLMLAISQDMPLFM